MNLHVERYGSGAPLLLIHGWGMHGGMWGEVVNRLAEQFCVHVVDLPGHGHSGVCSTPLRAEQEQGVPAQLEQIVDTLAVQFDEPLSLCGWSLGGQIALRWAMRYPQQIHRLVLVASTPCFVQQADWTCALEATTLQQFSVALQQHYAQTLRRFLALQVRGSEQERELLLTLRKTLFSRGEPELSALQAGLDILQDCDLRKHLAAIQNATLVVAGERDTLTPLAASEYMVNHLPNGRLSTISGAAHAPFLSHTEVFLQHLKRFLHE